MSLLESEQTSAPVLECTYCNTWGHMIEIQTRRAQNHKADVLNSWFQAGS